MWQWYRSTSTPFFDQSVLQRTALTTRTEGQEVFGEITIRFSPDIFGIIGQS
jgi:hypothetical protein